jgi:hypothetical protein
MRAEEGKPARMPGRRIDGGSVVCWMAAAAAGGHLNEK